MRQHKEILQKSLEEIALALRVAHDDAEKILKRLSAAAPVERFQQSLFQKTLDYIVDLDMAVARIHQHRQEILASQIKATAQSN